jgi:hypothetical protein
VCCSHHPQPARPATCESPAQQPRFGLLLPLCPSSFALFPSPFALPTLFRSDLTPHTHTRHAIFALPSVNPYTHNPNFTMTGTRSSARKRKQEDEEPEELVELPEDSDAESEEE